jgi:hypothetical protein
MASCESSHLTISQRESDHSAESALIGERMSGGEREVTKIVSQKEE